MAVKSLEDINDELKNKKNEEVGEVDSTEEEESDEELSEERPQRKFTSRKDEGSEEDPLDDESAEEEKDDDPKDDDEDELDDLDEEEAAQFAAKPTFTKEEREEDDDLASSPIATSSKNPEAEDQPEDYSSKFTASATREKTLDDLAEEESEETPASRPQFREEYEEINIPNLRTNPSGAGGQPPTNYMDEPSGEHNSFSNEHSSFSNRNPFPEKYYPHRKRASWWHVIILVLIGLAVIAATVFLLRNQLKPLNLPFLSQLNPTPTSTPTPEPTPTPTPTPEPLDRSKFKIKVLNGTTKTGLASEVTDKLKELGYQTEKGANATNSAFQQTVVRVKADQTALAEQLVKDLSPDFEASSASSLKDSDTIDGEIILGLK